VRPRLCVLHVDDDPETLTLVQMILDGEPDVEVVSCAGAVEALRIVATTRIDLLLLDVMMPGLDGPALLAELRSRPGLGYLPALFVTAKTHPRDLEALAQTSANGIIKKPFEASTLIAAVRNSLVPTAM
jgi:two-component system, OmpR family, response regulator